ncbi:helicase-associated domain-containing protein [Ferroacidibacillus organovorans]|uniref:Helicase XPB/Ssl2 N-terminal domain-containing protein n=1 Tax=Ferroacidibacillus organovorans TaxID=1765683 RepID=A0A853KG88_9BACL|nr:helicase-associated domain-containing protein [Ferroacidibacillus organovorans]KYP80922.1 hypothetical protein AYJ22_01865 [Ferroacidibacillus organovorans]OAG95354.1 hypothetical protein AYW79_00095 [Ferroacidibacillus organovorans]
MRLDYYLANLTKQKLLVIAEYLGQVVDGPKEKVAQSVIQSLVHGSGYTQLFHMLTDHDKRILRIAFVEMIGDGFVVSISKSRLLHLIEESYDGMPDVIPSINHLADLTMLIPTQIWYLGDGFEMPRECFDLLKMIYKDEVARLIPCVPKEHVTVERSLGSMFANDMIRLMTYISTHSVSATKNDVVYKRELQRIKLLFRTLHYQKEEVEEGPWAGFPEVVYLAFQILKDLSVITIGNGSVHPQGKLMREVLTQPFDELQQQIGETLFSNLLSPRMQSHFHVLLFEMIMSANEESWYAIYHGISSWLELPDGKRCAAHNTAARLISVLALIGQVDFGFDRKYGLVYKRCRPITARQGRISVQPNLDILVPDDVHPMLHFFVGQFATLKRADEMSLYTMDRESVLQLCDHGWREADLNDALDKYSSVAIGSSIKRSIRDWMIAYSRAVIWDAMFVRFEQEEVYQAFLADPRSKKCTVEAFDQVVVTMRSAEKVVREILSDLGAPAPLEVRSVTEDVPTTKAKRGAPNKANTQALRILQSRELIHLIDDALSIHSTL